MSLTKEQLLIPRVMCVGTEPGTPNDTSGNWVSGDIYYLDPWGKGVYKSYDNGREVSEPLIVHLAQSMPHLFKPLPWWYGRKPEDMPEYVKYHTGSVSKLTKEMIEYGGIVLEDYEPATEQEYWDSKPLRKCPDCGSEWKGDDSCPECFPI